MKQRGQHYWALTSFIVIIRHPCWSGRFTHTFDEVCWNSFLGRTHKDHPVHLEFLLNISILCSESIHSVFYAVLISCDKSLALGKSAKEDDFEKFFPLFIVLILNSSNVNNCWKQILLKFFFIATFFVPEWLWKSQVARLTGLMPFRKSISDYTCII